jgi:hypothetical protein
MNLAGRAQDGWKLAVGLKDGQVLQLGDYDRPEIVWSRVKTAGKGEVVFSGCRNEASGSLDGWAVFACAEEIRYVRNLGPAVAGAGSVEARITLLEEGLGRLTEGLTETAGDLDDLTNDLEDKGVIAPEPEEVPTGAAGNLTVMPATAETLQAVAAHDDEE